MKIAVASRTGTHVDLHFGRAETFFIYDIGEGEINLRESFEVVPYAPSAGDGSSHDFDAQRFNTVALLLKGCERLYCTRIGERPREELRRRGIEAVECDCAVASLPR